MSNQREHWGSRIGFILAASGSAVGLGNIWKFPHMAGENGGAAFTIVYLLCILIVGLPIVIGEFVLGRKTQLSPVGAFETLAPKSNWKWVGMLGVASAFVILSFYGVVGGWTLRYTSLSLMGGFDSLQSGIEVTFPDNTVIIPGETFFITKEKQNKNGAISFPFNGDMTVKGETFVFQSNRKYQDNKEKRHSLSDIDIENFSQIFPNLDIDKQLMKFKYDLKLNKKEYNNYPNAFWDWCHTNWTKHVNDSISINDINYNKDPIGIELGYNKIEFHNSSSKPVKLSDFKLVSNSDASASEFKSFKTNTWNPIFWQFIFMGICIWVIVNGVKGGIEKWSKIMMPAILVILIILMIRGLTLPKGSEALDFLFKPKFADLTPSSIVLALGHAFFTLSLGMGTMITYGSYLRSDQNLLSSALWIILLDTGIAIMAGVAIFATVFAMGADPGSGPGLIFEVLPTIFPKITGGAIWGTLFFFLLFLAALTSAISILEVVTAYFIDQKGWSRAKATSIFGIVITTVGIFCSLSMGGFTDFTTIFDLSFFDFMDYLSTKYMLPIGGMLTAIFIIYKWGVNQFMDEFKSGMNKMIISKNLITILLGIAASIVGFIILIEIFDVLFGIKLIQ